MQQLPLSTEEEVLLLLPLPLLLPTGGRTVRQWEAHDKRIWAVDFCPLDATTFATGSDDGTVKVVVCVCVVCGVCGVLMQAIAEQVSAVALLLLRVEAHKERLLCRLPVMFASQLFKHMHLALPAPLR